MGAILSILEVPVAMITERLQWSRRKATLSSVLLIAALGVPAALSQGVLAHTTLFGLSAFGLYDFVSSNVLLPVGGLLICLFVGWVIGPRWVQTQLTNQGTLNNLVLVKAIFFVVRFVSPILIVIVLLRGMKVI